VANLIVNAPADVISLGIEALARRAGVSTATVLRLCRSLGFGGYKEFKIALAVEMGRAPAVVFEDVRAGDTPMQIARKVFRADMQAISQTLGLLNERALNRAVTVLNSARRIEVYGVGSSAPIAMDAYYRFLRIGLRVVVVTDSHVQAVSAALLESGDVALVISHTGRTKATLETARLARERGAIVIALTSFLQSPIGDVANIVLVTAAAETAFRVEAMASRIAHLSLIDVLYVSIANRRLERALATLRRTNAIIEDLRL
jgi:DNA-binding MurR/RpiR family transcriptional regulator